MIQRLGLSIKEHDELRENDPDRYWLYYYYLRAAEVVERKRAKEAADMRKPRGGDLTGKTNEIQFPEHFVSTCPKEELPALEAELRKQKLERMRLEKNENR